MNNLTIITDVNDTATKRPYKCFWNSKIVGVMASSSYKAQLLATKHFGAKKSYDVAVMLTDVVRSTASI